MDKPWQCTAFKIFNWMMAGWLGFYLVEAINTVGSMELQITHDAAVAVALSGAVQIITLWAAGSLIIGIPIALKGIQGTT